MKDKILESPIKIYTKEDLLALDLGRRLLSRYRNKNSKNEKLIKKMIREVC